MFQFLLIGLALLLSAGRAEINDLSNSDSVDEISETLAAKLWQPEVGEPWQIILNSTLELNTTAPLEPTEVKIFELDLFDTPKSTIDELHEQDVKVICYFSGGTAEDWRPDYASFKKEDKGACLPRWVGERYIDIRKQGIFEVMKKRIETAKEKGCDAIDPDNIDVFSNNAGFRPRLTKRDAVAYFRKLAREAAKNGMSTGLKNAASMLQDVSKDIQFAVNEECVNERNCNDYSTFVSPRRRLGWFNRGNQAVGKPVFHIEYTAESMKGGPVRGKKNVGKRDTNAENAANTRRQCLVGNRLGRLFSTVIKKVNLDGWVEYCDGDVFTTTTKQGTVIKGLAKECKGVGKAEKNKKKTKSG